MSRWIYFVFCSLLFVPYIANASYGTCANEPVACAVYKEARGESKKGQLSVAFVVYNRVKDRRFPKTPKAVVFQKSQFSWTRKRQYAIKDKQAFAKARAIAKHVGTLAANNPEEYKRQDPTHGALFFNRDSSFFSHKKLRPKHYKSNSFNTVKIGNHVFYGKVAMNDRHYFYRK